jgi:uncharacterized membrane protein YkvA (DUF1232 family)
MAAFVLILLCDVLPLIPHKDDVFIVPAALGLPHRLLSLIH